MGFIVYECMTEGCEARIPKGELGFAYYCEACIEKQLEAHRQERQAFDDFHKYADQIAKGN